MTEFYVSSHSKRKGFSVTLRWFLPILMCFSYVLLQDFLYLFSTAWLNGRNAEFCQRIIKSISLS